VHPVTHVVDLEGSATGKINRTHHGFSPASTGIAGHGKNNLTVLIPLHFAVSNGIVVIDGLAFVDVDDNIFASEKPNVNLVHVVHQALKNFLIQFYKLVLLGEFQITHRTRRFGNLILKELRLFPQAIVRRRHSAQQNRARSYDDFLIQKPYTLGTLNPSNQLQY
jgi:hypothetical protein